MTLFWLLLLLLVLVVPCVCVCVCVCGNEELPFFSAGERRVGKSHYGTAIRTLVIPLFDVRLVFVCC